MIDSHARRRSCATEPVQADPLADLLVCPGVVVCPGDQFLVDPGQQRDGTVSKHGPDSLGSGPHHVKVVAAIILVVLGSFQAGLFLRRIEIQHMSSEKSHEAKW